MVCLLSFNMALVNLCSDNMNQMFYILGFIIFTLICCFDSLTYMQKCQMFIYSGLAISFLLVSIGSLAKCLFIDRTHFKSGRRIKWGCAKIPNHCLLSK